MSSPRLLVARPRVARRRVMLFKLRAPKFKIVRLRGPFPGGK